MRAKSQVARKSSWCCGHTMLHEDTIEDAKGTPVVLDICKVWSQGILWYCSVSSDFLSSVRDEVSIGDKVTRLQWPMAVYSPLCVFLSNAYVIM